MTTHKSVSLVEYAAMCKDVYRQHEKFIYHTITECGWERVFEWTEGAFFARLYGRKSDKMSVLAYRGTEGFDHWTGYANWGNNFRLGAAGGQVQALSSSLSHSKISKALLPAPLHLTVSAFSSPYPDLAVKTYIKAVDEASNKNFSAPVAVTGHSLGGFLAQHSSIVISNHIKYEKTRGKLPNSSPLYAITFNPLNVGEAISNEVLGKAPLQPAKKHVFDFNINTDIVHKIVNAQGTQHQIQGKVTCSVETIQEQRTPTGLLDVYLMSYRMGNTLGRFVSCSSLAEHKIEVVIEKLWTMLQETYGDGDSKMPVRPKNVTVHKDHSIPEIEHAAH
jgi:hypothetical protein